MRHGLRESRSRPSFSITIHQVAHPEWLLGDNDPKAAAITRSRLFAEWADRTILVIGTHFAAPTAGRVVRDAAVFRFAV